MAKSHPLPACKAVVFDLDGTLIDTLYELAFFTNQTLTQHGFPPHSIDRYRHFVGDGARMLITRALPEHHRDETTIELCLATFLKLYEMRCGEFVTVYPGIVDLLSFLNQKNIRMAILSNKPHHLTLKNVDLLLKEFPFAPIFGERDGVPKKPDPTGAVEISKHLEVPPSEIIYLGDTAIDMKTAVTAGMYPVGVLWGFRDRNELEEHGAELIVASPAELMSIMT